MYHVATRVITRNNINSRQWGKTLPVLTSYSKVTKQVSTQISREKHSEQRGHQMPAHLKFCCRGCTMASISHGALAMSSMLPTLILLQWPSNAAPLSAVPPFYLLLHGGFLWRMELKCNPGGWWDVPKCDALRCPLWEWTPSKGGDQTDN
jgi:hypothetical protein